MLLSAEDLSSIEFVPFLSDLLLGLLSQHSVYLRDTVKHVSFCWCFLYMCIHFRCHSQVFRQYLLYVDAETVELLLDALTRDPDEAIAEDEEEGGDMDVDMDDDGEESGFICDGRRFPMS